MPSDLTTAERRQRNSRIRAAHKAGVSQCELARLFEMTEGNISWIVNGRTPRPGQTRPEDRPRGDPWAGTWFGNERYIR
jgi:Mor family transcriptional regulator